MRPIVHHCGNCGSTFRTGEWHSCPTSEAVEDNVAERIAAWVQRDGWALGRHALARAIRRGEWRKEGR